MKRLHLPGATGRRALGLGALAWLGALGGRLLGWPAVVIAAAVSAPLLGRRRWLAAAVLVAGSLSGWTAEARIQSTLRAAVPEGPVTLLGVVADEPVADEPVADEPVADEPVADEPVADEPVADEPVADEPVADEPVSEEPVAAGGGFRFVFEPKPAAVPGGWRAVDLPPIAIHSDDAEHRPTSGDTVVARGVLRSGPGRVRGDPIAGRLDASSVERIAGTPNPVAAIGNALRSRVASQIGAHSRGAEAGLLQGFLIGDTSGLDGQDLDDLRRAGLSHFVAVSGSNVALFLAAWWLATAWLASHPRARAAIGLVGLAIFVVATRWEPSVVRAAVMASVVLGGRLVGHPIDTWTALGASAAGLIILSGDLAVGVGFQLSVVAAAGVLAGAGALRGRRPAWAWAALSATIAAQAAVTPLLLWHFGTVPLFSPLANLAALPLVTLATVAGGVGVLSGWSPLVAAGSAFTAGVLWIARIAAGWPQLGPAGLTLVIAIALLAMAKAMRKVVVVAVAAAALRFLAPPGLPEGPTATFLDVGQGDAVVLRDDLGSVILIDGGRDPVVLTAGLRRTGVGRIDVLVVTHGDADHAGGLDGIFEHIDVRHLWVPDQPGLGLILSSVIEQAAAHGVPVEHLRSGVSVSIGRFAVEVIGPRRRYLSSNNGSVVLWVRAGPPPCCSPATSRRSPNASCPSCTPTYCSYRITGRQRTTSGGSAGRRATCRSCRWETTPMGTRHRPCSMLWFVPARKST